MNKEEKIKLEYTKELYNRTIRREKELEKEADKIFGEIKIDIHNLITEKLVLRNIKEGLFEKIKKQARQAGIQQGKLELQKWCEKWWRHQETSNELWKHSTEENLIRFLEALKKEVKSQNEK